MSIEKLRATLGYRVTPKELIKTGILDPNANPSPSRT